MNRLTTAHAEYDLLRWPADPSDQLRAWDAADAYLLRHLEGPDAPTGTSPDGTDAAEPGIAPATAEPVDLSGTVVLLGDRWGALATALAQHGPVQIGDSFLAQEATRANLAANGLDLDMVRLLSTQDQPPPRIDVLLVRVPKSLALLEDQLCRLAPSLHPGTVVVGTGMTTEIHTSTLKLFERILGPTRTSLAVRKARLIFCTPRPRPTAPVSPWPISYALPDGVGVVSGRTVSNHAGIFCAEHLDIGTRFLLQHLPRRDGRELVVDLGCGNGVVGTAVALANPQAELLFTDESFQAVASARETFAANLGPDRVARFEAADGLVDVAPGSVDLVLNNPPFHTYRAEGDAVAWRMFTGARTALRPGGELWVIGNRHLGYHAKLKRLFGNAQLVASDRKFVVLRAVRQRR
ncbi:methyltransferase [Streptacidiphilus sp. EB129]|uniref:methyltransferase n=1 Tax=Streptacidiphilus sp. EB129 TaxID=3156262 RepID=UPI003518CAAD